MENDKYSLEHFEVFICYRESPDGKIFAEFTKKILSKFYHLNSFVAHKPRDTYSHQFDEIRKRIIKECRFFLFINSAEAFDSVEIKKEFKIAYPANLTENPELIVLRHASPEVKYSDDLFKLETGIDLSGVNQASFTDVSKLYDVIQDVFNNKKYSPYLNKTKTRLLEDYLKGCISIIDKKNILDNKSLNDTFICNKSILVDVDKWNTKEQEIPTSESEDWNIDKFLSSNERYVLIGAPFGIGKTSYACKLTADMAEKYLTKYNSFIPIYVPLKNHLNNIDENGNNLQTIMSYIPNKESRILFILDGIDEFGDREKIISLYNEVITPNIRDYINCKFLLTTRLKAGLPQLFYTKKYVRLLSFSDEQVDHFMEKYKIPLRNSAIVQAGLSSDEIAKPLFCRMIAIIYDKEKTLQFGEDIKLNRTLLYHRFIHNIVLGKDRQTSLDYDYEKHYLNEKKMLRKIAELKYIYEDSLTVKGIEDSIINLDSSIREHFTELFDRLISSYFHIKDTNNYEQRIDFIHKSFVEYLVAEFYLESCLADRFTNINMSTLSLDTISFLEGLLYLIKSERNDTDSYFNQIITSFGFGNITKTKIRSNLIGLAEKNFERETILLADGVNYPQTKDIIAYKNLQNHRWISILILNKLGNNYRIDSEVFFKFIRNTNTSVLGYIVTIENLDLSYSRIEEDLSDYNLSQGKLSHSTFYGNFFGTKFIGADLSYSEIKIGTRFMGCDLSGANLSNLKVEHERATSPFVAHFFNCNFEDCNMTNGVYQMTSFTLSKFNKANLSGVNLNWADISLTDMREIIIDEKTDTKDVNLLSKGYYFEWEDVRENKNLIKAILNDFNPVNFDPKMRDKILHDNPEYRW